MAIIEVNHVTKEFRLGQLQTIKVGMQRMAARLRGQPLPPRTNFKALDDVDFRIEEGEVVGIIGHNGAGKSTLLKILSRITVPTKGDVKVRGRVAPLIEVGAGLVADMTGRENIFLNATILGMSKKEIKRKFDEIVAFAELEEFIDTPIKRYSSGMSVRLGFSVATSVDADILIVDEVLAVGDVAFQRKCIERMEQIITSGHKTVLVVGHNIRQLERMSSRMILLNHGHVVLDGDPTTVCNTFFEEAGRKISIQSHSVGVIKPIHDVGRVKVVGIELVGSSAAHGMPELPMHGAVRIRITVEVNRKLALPEIVIGAHTPDMVYIFSMSSSLSAVRQDLVEGTNEIECVLSDLPLRPGQYSLRLGVLDQLRNLLWYGENLTPFRVVPGEVDVTRIPELGLVHLGCEWKIGAQAGAVENLTEYQEIAAGARRR